MDTVDDVVTWRHDLVSRAAVTWRGVTESRHELSIKLVLLPDAAPAATATVERADGEVAIAAVGAGSSGHLRDACGVHHGGLTTPDLVTCCLQSWSTDRDDTRVLHTRNRSNYPTITFNLHIILFSIASKSCVCDATYTAFKENSVNTYLYRCKSYTIYEL